MDCAYSPFSHVPKIREEWILGRLRTQSNLTRPKSKRGRDMREAASTVPKVREEWVLGRLRIQSNLTRPKSKREMGIREAARTVQSHTSQK